MASSWLRCGLLAAAQPAVLYSDCFAGQPQKSRQLGSSAGPWSDLVWQVWRRLWPSKCI